jgi:DUF2938 family protein
MNYSIHALAIGAGATLVMDLWGIVRARLLRAPALNYGLVGRWLAYLPRGQFHHSPIAASPPVRGELLIGWTAHYAIGIAFAAILLALYGAEWVCRPTIGPALVVGIGSVVAPFFLMQPGMGAGVAASRTPKPSAARLNSLLTHTVFALGLYAAARVTAPLLCSA